MPDMVLNIQLHDQPVQVVTITVEEPKRCELFRGQLEAAGQFFLLLAVQEENARVAPAITNHDGQQNLSVLLGWLAKILDLQVAPAIALEVGENIEANPLRAFYWQGASSVDGEAHDQLDYVEHAQPEGLVAYYRFLALALDRNFNPAEEIPDAEAVNGRNPAAYRNQGVTSFYARHANLQARSITVYMNFRRFIETMITRLLHDWADVQRYFFANQDVAQLEQITISGSDTHKGGCQVAILTLSGGRQLVYKPTDIEWDTLVAGDVTTLAAMSDHLQGNCAATVARWATVANTNNFTNIRGLGTPRSLAQLFNSLIPSVVFGASPPKLPTYKIMPCSAGSTLAVQPDGSRAIRNSYGYIEHLPSDPTIDRTFPGATSESFHNYGFQVGQWQALMMLSNITDMHQENLFICNRKPFPIDMEITDFGYTNNPGMTQLVSRGIQNCPELGTFFEFNIDATRLAYSYARAPVADGEDYMKNQAFVPVLVQVTAQRADILQGFAQAYSLIAKEFPSFTNFFTHLLSGVVVRRLPPQLSTGNLIEKQSMMIGKTDVQIDNLCAGYATQRLALWERKAKEWRAMYPNSLLSLTDETMSARQDALDLNTKELMPDFAVYTAVATDFKNGDVPAFYQVYGSEELMDSFGRRIGVTAATATPVSGDTVQALYPWQAVEEGGLIYNVIPRPQVAVQMNALRKLVAPVQTEVEHFLNDVARQM